MAPTLWVGGGAGQLRHHGGEIRVRVGYGSLYRCHRTPSRFARDREQDVEWAMKGRRTLPFTWRQVKARGEWVAAAIG
jgi:hypothetical protein